MNQFERIKAVEKGGGSPQARWDESKDFTYIEKETMDIEQRIVELEDFREKVYGDIQKLYDLCHIQTQTIKNLSDCIIELQRKGENPLCPTL